MAVVVEVMVEVGGGVGRVGGGGGAEDAVLDEGFVEGALGGGFVAVEGGEGVVGVVGEASEEVGGGAGVGKRLEIGGRGGGLDAVTLVVGELLVVLGVGGAVGGFDFFAVVLVGEVEEMGFGLGMAAEFPAEEADAFDEEFFEGRLGIEVVAEIEEEVGVVGLLGLGDEEGGVEGGAEAVAEGVAGGAGFAVGGAWTGGVEGVGAVGEEGFGGFVVGIGDG